MEVLNYQLIYYAMISKSDYYRYKEDNKKEKIENKILRDKLRNS